MIALLGQLFDLGLARGMGSTLGRERRLKRRDTCNKRIGREYRRLRLVHRREFL